LAEASEGSSASEASDGHLESLVCGLLTGATCMADDSDDNEAAMNSRIVDLDVWILGVWILDSGCLELQNVIFFKIGS
jgi:hypothetical protein